MQHMLICGTRLCASRCATQSYSSKMKEYAVDMATQLESALTIAGDELSSATPSNAGIVGRLQVLLKVIGDIEDEVAE